MSAEISLRYSDSFFDTHMVTWQFCATFCSIVVNLQCLVIHMVCVLIVLEVLMTFVQSI